LSCLVTGSTEIRTYGFSFEILRRNEQLQSGSGLTTDRRLLRYRYYKDLAPAEPVLAFLVRQLLLRLPHDPQEVALCYPD
jgi:hypothetical protein